MQQIIKIILALFYTLTFLGICLQAQAQTSGLITSGAEVEEAASGFVFTEGPAADEAGNLYFTDVRTSTIYFIDTDGQLETFMENTNGANGLFFDENWQLYACIGNLGRISRINTENATATPLISGYQGSAFNSPNDLWVDASGGIYFTDPRYGDESNLPQDGYHVYYLPAGSSEAIRVIDDLVRPNGIIGTRDGSTLYVADAEANITYAYDIDAPGQVSGKRVYVTLGSDGVSLDERGNLYLTGGGRVTIYAPGGALIETIDVPQAPSNLTFGGPDRQTLYITARTGLYTLRMNVRGMY
ncbi:SMP-30/gluconolactonase/LRE family protein [Gammaproteobacteria bacterium AH-315-E17]|nr:SMP-30/gluconolactonase/LRE family protein [Gammaproteobacteria bacterium AH-315-E17]